MLSSQFIHQSTLADGWETNEATVNCEYVAVEISLPSSIRVLTHSQHQYAQHRNRLKTQLATEKFL